MTQNAHVVKVMNNDEFNPDWVSSPGDTISDVLGERGWTYTELAEKLEWDEEYIYFLLIGDALLTEELAFRLSNTIGSTPDFWMTREKKYREALKKAKHKRSKPQN